MMIKPFKTLPIANNRTLGKNIVKIVDNILSANVKNQKEDTLHLQKQVDELVYKLYDLTYEEVKVIDPEFWLSEEEYEKVKLN